MKNIISLFCISFLVFAFGSCKKNPVEPIEEDENLTPGRRDYTWTIDTIKNQYIHLYGIWGKAPNEVYVVGPGAGEKIWRYDGTAWVFESRVYIRDPIDIFGIDNKMWICGADGEIWRYENGTFKNEIDILQNENKPVSFFDIDGKSVNEIYATASKTHQDSKDGLVYSYDGSRWRLQKTFENSGVFNVFRYSPKNDKYYCNSVYQNDADVMIERIFEFDRNNLKLLNEHLLSSQNPSSIHIIEGYIYITLGTKVYRYRNDNMNLMFEVNDPNFGGQLWGRSRNDILIRMFDGIAHYNGTDRQYLLKIPSNIWLAGEAIVFEKEIFIPAKDYNSGYQLMYHGILR